jgi:hypothetical protein
VRDFMLFFCTVLFTGRRADCGVGVGGLACVP